MGRAGRGALKIVRVIIRIGTRVVAPRITAIFIHAQDRERRIFFVCRARAHAHLINNRCAIRHRQRDPAIVRDSDGVCLIAICRSAVPAIGICVGEQIAFAARKQYRCINCDARIGHARTARRFDQPAANVERTIGWIVQFDKFVVAAIRTARAKFGDDNVIQTWTGRVRNAGGENVRARIWNDNRLPDKNPIRIGDAVDERERVNAGVVANREAE